MTIVVQQHMQFDTTPILADRGPGKGRQAEPDGVASKQNSQDLKWKCVLGSLRLTRRTFQRTNPGKTPQAAGC